MTYVKFGKPSLLSRNKKLIPTTLLGTATIPNDGGELRLTQRGNEFSIHLKGVAAGLMNSRMNCSEVALGELGCVHIKGIENTRVLVGGLGMGFTLSAVLKAVSVSSQVIVAELIPEVVDWNKGPLGECACRPLADKRVQTYIGDVADLFKDRQATYDAVLLDVDNGPEGFTQIANNKLYSNKSLQAIQKTLRPGGVLAIWSAWHDPKFSRQLRNARYKVEEKTVRAHKGKGSSHTIYLATKMRNSNG